MRVYSFHPSRRAAVEFAEGLKEKGAQGVEVGKGTSAGYPVSSEVSDERSEEVEARIQAHVPPDTEDYGYKTTITPATSVEGMYEVGGEKVQVSPDELLDIAKWELRRVGLPKVKVRISRYQGRDPEAPYADATTIRRGKRVTINLHPVLCYADEDYIKAVIRHEIGDIRRKKEV